MIRYDQRTELFYLEAASEPFVARSTFRLEMLLAVSWKRPWGRLGADEDVRGITGDLARLTWLKVRI